MYSENTDVFYYVWEEGKQMKIVVIGSGKLGNSLATKLAEEGHDIAVIDNNEHALAVSLKNNNISENISFCDKK